MKRFLLWLSIPLLAWYVSGHWYQLMLIQGRSMEPTYHHLQLVILNKHDRSFQHGDVVAFRCDGLSSVVVKRVIAGPEDSAQIVDGTLLVNERTSEVFTESGRFAYAGELEELITLGNEEYLVIGDNTNESIDSRYPEVGTVSEIDILGKIVTVD